MTPAFPPDLGGVARATERLALALYESGQLAYLASPRPPAHTYLPYLALDSDTLALQAAYQQRPWQILHAYYPSLTGDTAVAWKQEHAAALIFSARGNDLDRDLWLPERRETLLQVLPEAQALTGVTRDLSLKMQALMPQISCHYVPNAVNSELFVPAEPQQRRALRQSLALPENLTLLGFVGEARLKKGLPLLLEAFATLYASLNLGLVIAGHIRPGPDLELFELWKKQHPQAAQRVFILAERASIALVTVYQALDVLVFPSYQEGMANAALEAMSCAKAVVATTVGGFPDSIQHGQEGWLIEPFSAPALIAALRHVCSDLGLCQRLGQAARQRILSEFQLQHELSRLQALYCECIRAHVR